MWQESDNYYVGVVMNSGKEQRWRLLIMIALERNKLLARR